MESAVSTQALRVSRSIMDRWSFPRMETPQAPWFCFRTASCPKETQVAVAERVLHDQRHSLSLLDEACT